MKDCAISSEYGCGISDVICATSQSPHSLATRGASASENVRSWMGSEVMRSDKAKKEAGAKAGR